MQKIKIGADELILWLRKNAIAKTTSNDVLGKTIRKIIGDPVNEDYPVLWSISDDNTVDEYKLPKTSAQYEMDIEKLPDLYRQLLNIE